MSSPLSASELCEVIVRSGLLSPDALEPYAGTDESPENTARRLVRGGLLTAFQARALLKGRERGFFLTPRYKVLDFIGEGGMGKVYLCEQIILHRLVAVKLLNLGGREGRKPMASLAERFYREARAVATLDHPNIVRVIDVDRARQQPFMVMEYVDGSNLHEIVTREGPFDPLRAAHYVAQAAAGLRHAHEAGLVHRDVKPSNLMLDRAGTVKLLDLGLARFSQDTERNGGITTRFERDKILGTMDWIAPEQAEDSTSADARSDIYSLGCTMYFMLTGGVPFPADSPPEKLALHRTQAPASLSGFFPMPPAGLMDVLDRMIEKDPADRYQNAGEVVAALAEITASPIQPPSDSEMPPRPAASFKLGLSRGPPAEIDRTPEAGTAGETRPEAKPKAVPPAQYPLKRVIAGGFIAGVIGAMLTGLIWWLATR